MNWELLIQSLLIPLAVAVLRYLIPYLKAKTQEHLEAKRKSENDILFKNLALASETVFEVVTTVGQTYVDELKKSGKFDKEAQEQAFDKAADLARELLSQSLIDIIESVFGDFESWLYTKIESFVPQTKPLAEIKTTALYS